MLYLYKKREQAFYMKIVIAPDSFKGSLTARQAASAMEQGVRKVFSDAELEFIPMADGGEGTLQVLIDSTKGKLKEVRAVDPLGRSIIGQYGILGNDRTAVIEMSTVSGLLLLKENERNPLHTTTIGTGKLILDALDTGYRNLIIAIGGSATNDCGSGMAQALGVRFFRKDKTEINNMMCGKLLGDIAAVDVAYIHPAVHSSHIIIACDVKNPLLGENGCTLMYAKQKGATSEMITRLEENMVSFIDIAEKTIGKSVRDIPGAGAAGGLGAGLILFLGAEIKSGVEVVMEACDFTRRIKDATLILTGEGRIDKQTAFGKSIAGIAQCAKIKKIPVIAFAGTIENDDELYQLGITKWYSIRPEKMIVEEAMTDAARLLQNSVEKAMWDYKIT
jgi:glycerate kinase